MSKYLILILISAFLLSIAYSFYFRIEPSVDARGYDRIAQNIAAGLGYVEKPDESFAYEAAISRVGPGYQFFLAGIYKIFGRNIPLVWVLQAVIHTLSGFFIYLISKKIFKDFKNRETVALMSALLFLFFIDIFELTAMVLTETLFLFLLILSVYSAIKFFEDPNYKNSAFAGFAFGFGILTRPTVLPLLMIILGVMIYKKYFKFAALFLIIPVLIISPWTIRNYKVHNAFILTSSAGGINLWMGNNPRATGESFYTEEMSEYIKTHGFVAAEKKGFEEGKKFIIDNPLKFIKLIFIKTSIYFSLARPAAFWFHLSGFKMAVTAILSSIFAFIIFSFGTLGIIAALRKRNFNINLLFSYALIAPLIVIPLVVETRYRYQIYPFLIIFAGFFISDIKNYLKESFWKKITFAVILVFVLNSLFDLMFHFSQFQKYFGKIL